MNIGKDHNAPKRKIGVVTFQSQKRGSIETQAFRLTNEERSSVFSVLDDWITRRQNLMFLPKKSYFHIRMRKIEGRGYHCQAQIRIGYRTWVGLGQGMSPMKSALNALSEMLPQIGVDESSGIGSSDALITLHS